MVEEEKEYDGDISEDDKADPGSWLPRAMTWLQRIKQWSAMHM